MAKFIIEYSENALKDLSKIKKAGNKSEIKKVTTLLQEIEETPRKGTGNPERLKYHKGEIWSRRINKKDRLVYEIFEEKVTITIIQAVGHYDDK